MSNTALEILNSSQQQAAQAMGLISQQMTQTASLTLQKERFIAEQAMRQAEFAEQSRYNDAQLRETAFRNSILAAEYEVKKQLMPLQIETEQLKLQNAKTNAQRQTTLYNQGQFNSLTKPFDTIISANFMKNQSPEYAKGYLAIKSKYESNILKGGTWDDEAYAKEIRKLNDGFKGVTAPVDTEYNPEVSFLMGALGDTSGKARYDGAHDPNISKAMSGIRGTILTGSDSDMVKVMNSHGNKFTPEELSSLQITRDDLAYQDFEIKLLFEQGSKLSTAALADPTGSLDKAIKQNHDDIAAATERRRQTLANALGGIKITPKGTPPPSKSESDLDKVTKEANLDKVPPSKLDPFNKQEDSAVEKKDIAVRDFSSKLITEDKEGNPVNPLGGLNESLIKAGQDDWTVDWLSEPADSQNKIGAVRGLLHRNLNVGLNRMSNDDLVSLIHNPAIEDVVLSGKPIIVKSSKPGKEYIIGKGATALSIDSNLGGEGFISEGRANKERYAISSMDELKKMIKSSGMNEAETRRNFIDIYSALVIAGLEQSTK